MTFLIPLLLLATSSIFAQDPPKPEEEAVFRTSVAQVRVDVQVLRDGKPVTGLTKADFVVTDGGEARKIAYFGRDEEPLAVMLLMDVSGSMRRYLEQMGATAQRALGQLGPVDRVGVAVFSKGTKTFLPLSAKIKEAAREIEVAALDAKMPAGTAINAALVDIAAQMKKDRMEQPQPSRRSILILTDNGSLNYQVSDEMVLRALYDADTVLNAMVVGEGNRRRRVSMNPDFTPADVFRLAEESGGEAVKADRADRMFPEMIARMRIRYSLAYDAPASSTPGEFRAIRVDLTPDAKRRYPNAQIRARRGYYAAQ